MAIKNYNDLIKTDISGQTSKKPVFKRNKKTGEMEQAGELDYLNWADCLALLHANGAECVKFGNVKSKEDHPLFLINGSLPFVRVFVDVDGDRRELDYPVIDGSKDLTMDKITQSDIHNASQRAFVKCVAVNWGLGLPLWQREEKEQSTGNGIDLVEVSNIHAIQERINRLITACMKRGFTEDDLIERLGINKKTYALTKMAFQNIAAMESGLTKILNS